MDSKDLAHIRSFFPALNNEFVFFDNAGGTQTAFPVVDRINDYLLHTNVQLGASYPISQQAGERVDEARKLWAKMINAARDDEIIFGSSTTQLLQNLSKSMAQTLKPGDEVIVTNCDHEANIGPWLALQKFGVRVKQWNVNPESCQLDLDELEGMLTANTRLLAFTHASNVLGLINPVKAIVETAHKNGTLVCVDGVAYAPHRLIDVQDMDADFYVFSMYKVYGPHYSLLYGKKEILESLPGINHYFIGEEELPYKFQPGNVNFELTYGSMGVMDYFSAIYSQLSGKPPTVPFETLTYIFNKISLHEEKLSGLLLDFLKTKKSFRIIGPSSADARVRVPTISFVVEGNNSRDITLKTDLHKIGIRYGDFYARRLIDFLNLNPYEGVVRVSMVHYNTPDEVYRLIKVLDGLF